MNEYVYPFGRTRKIRYLKLLEYIYSKIKDEKLLIIPLISSILKDA